MSVSTTGALRILGSASPVRSPAKSSTSAWVSGGRPMSAVEARTMNARSAPVTMGAPWLDCRACPTSGVSLLQAEPAAAALTAASKTFSRALDVIAEYLPSQRRSRDVLLRVTERLAQIADVEDIGSVFAPERIDTERDEHRRAQIGRCDRADGRAAP